MFAWERAKLGPEPPDTPNNNAAIALCVRAWNELDSSRQLGYGHASAIPYAAMLTWAESRGLDRETFDLVKDVVRILDMERAIKLNSEQKAK